MNGARGIFFRILMNASHCGVGIQSGKASGFALVNANPSVSSSDLPQCGQVFIGSGL